MSSDLAHSYNACDGGMLISRFPAVRTSKSVPYFIAVFAVGGAIGSVGGMIGLGGAEFRLPLLISLFGFPGLEAIILNKAMSLVVVASALPFRAATVPLSAIAEHWPVIVNLLGGSLFGAWFGAGWAIRLKSKTLYKIIAALLLMIALVLVFSHEVVGLGQPIATGSAQVAAGIATGFGIGVVASLLGIAGGELLIPTLILLFGVDIKLAGSLSLAVSLPTILMGFARYSRDQSFVVLARSHVFACTMALGSVSGTFLGGQLLGVVPSAVLLPLLAIVLIASAVKVWSHG